MSRIEQAQAGRSLPDLLMQDFEAGCKGTADVDMHEVLHAILADVLDSVSLALEGVGMSSTNRKIVRESIEDYIANHYGSD